jgi:hypothetical protein
MIMLDTNRYKSDPMYPHARGRVSTWPCINVAMYPHTCGRVSTSEFAYALWATPQNHRPQRRITGNSLKSLPQPFKEKVYIYIMHYPRPIPSMLEIFHSLEKKLILRCGLLRRMIF